MPKDPGIYVKSPSANSKYATAGFWVDDCIVIGSQRELTSLTKSVDAKYGITGLGEVRWVLSMLLECDCSKRTITISQEAFIDSILTHFNLVDMTTIMMPFTPGSHLSSTNCPTDDNKIHEKGTCPYRELIRALLWLTLSTQPDIAFAAGSLAHFGHNPSHIHWEAVKWVLCYPKMWHLKLGGKTLQITTSTNADWGSHSNDHHLIGTYIIKVGIGAISWKSKKQACVALLSSEVEYMALCQASKEAVWTADFLGNIGVELWGPMVVNADNQGSIALTKNPVFHDHSKHVDIQYHLMHNLVKQEKIQLNYVPTKDMLADTLMKSLPQAQHELLSIGIGMF